MRLTVYNVCVVVGMCITVSQTVVGHGRRSGSWWRTPVRRIPCNRPVPDDRIESPIAVIPEQRRVVGECFADINRCPSGSCVLRKREIRYNFWSRIYVMRCPVYGVINPVTTSDTVDCGVFGSREIDRVISCICEVDFGIEVNVRVVESSSNDLLSGIYVTVNGRSVIKTEVAGEYMTYVPSQTRSISVSAQDRTGDFVSVVKNVDVPVGFRGPINVEVPLVKVAEPVQIDPSVKQELSISDDPLNQNAGVAKLTINPNTFRNQDGSPYSGTVSASVNFIDVSNPSIEGEIPGQFLTRDSRFGETSPLISDGMFSLTFKDTSGTLLEFDSVTVTVRDDMRLWSLGTNGLWEPLVEEDDGPVDSLFGDLGARKKRQTSLIEFNITVENAQWVNIDKIPGAPLCYFKARVFQSDGTTEIQSSTTATFQNQILSFITSVSPPQRLRQYTPSTRAPADTCFSVRCPVVVNNNSLTGFINMTSYESVIVGGVSIPVITSLTPRSLIQYSSSIYGSLNAILYEVASNNVDAFVNFISNSTGPFYTNRTVCENSAVTDPAFHFIKSPLPSYEPIPMDTDLCTARVGIYLGQDASDIFANLSVPNITAVSTWSENGTNFFYTDNAVIDVSINNTNSSYISVCITYRCSEPGSLSTVYLTINAPNITVPANTYDDYSGSWSLEDENVTATSNETVTVPAISCYGECGGRLCFSNQQNTGINGSFIAPEGVANGPDFYLGANNVNCTQGTNQADVFATTLFCYANKRWFDGSQPA